MAYFLDTSILIDFISLYSLEIENPTLYQLFNTNLKNGGFVIPDVMLDEILDPDGAKMLKTNYPDSLVPSVPEIQKIQLIIVKKYKNLINPHNGRSRMDPWIIAHAKFYNQSVLSKEEISIHDINNFNKIPDLALKKIPQICRREDIPCESLVTFLSKLI